MVCFLRKVGNVCFPLAVVVSIVSVIKLHFKLEAHFFKLFPSLLLKLFLTFFFKHLLPYYVITDNELGTRWGLDYEKEKLWNSYIWKLVMVAFLFVFPCYEWFCILACLQLCIKFSDASLILLFIERSRTNLIEIKDVLHYTKYKHLLVSGCCIFKILLMALEP